VDPGGDDAARRVSAVRGIWTPWSGSDDLGPMSGPPARAVVYCFGHAGGAAGSYRNWARRTAGQDVEICPVELPGHGTRMSEAQLTDIDDLLDLLIEALFDHRPGPPFALFGHSMGATIAYALAVRLKRAAALAPLGLIVSGARPPGSPEPSPMMASLSDEDLLSTLIDLDGTPGEILKSPEMVEFMLQRLRTDLALLESAERTPTEVLDCPIDAFCGTDDEISGPRLMQGWAALTSREFRSRTFSGGHFYLDRFEAASLSQLGEAVIRYLDGAGRV
jgi:medium-chain acyl-[acyl-carrier-protein] hydrolase